MSDVAVDATQAPVPLTPVALTPVTLTKADWTARARAHRTRAEALLDAFATSDGGPHPVWDFLLTYYSLRPGQLRTWHPGYGVALADGECYLTRTGYAPAGDGVAVSRDYLMTRSSTVEFVHGLLRATATRAPRLNCFGLHEWAMVYRAPTVRHAQVPLRLGAAGTDAVVESMPLRCSHFDAYRFFTEPAARRNEGTPTRSDQVEREQPGCLHANMDLYKWTFKLGPLVESSMVLDCLQLAADARVLDMRASPYDLRVYGFAPIEIETPAGRAEYVRAQQAIAERAAPLRAELTARCGELLSAANAVVSGG